MKSLLLPCLFLLGCTTHVLASVKPSGESVLASLFDASDVLLSQEPLCNKASPSMNKSHLQLKDLLATVLAGSYESKNKTVVTTSCNASKHELKKGNLVDIWDCMLMVNESDSNKNFISSSTIAFGLDTKDLTFIPQSLRCF